MKLQIEVNGDTIVEARFKTYGCGSAIASSSYVTESIKGKTLTEAMGITNNDIASHLALPPVKLHCSLLAEQAIKAAVSDFMKKKDAGKAVDVSIVGKEASSVGDSTPKAAHATPNN